MALDKTGKPFAAAILLGLLGFAGNLLTLELFFSVNFLFGSIFAMLAALRSDWRYGSVAGFIAASCTWFLWGHPWAVVVLTCETAFVGCMYSRRKGNPVLYDMIYWICAGMPLTCLFGHYAMAEDIQGTVLLMLKQSVNGTFNALAATIALTLSGPGKKFSEERIAFSRLIFVVMVTLVLLPALLFLVMGMRTYMKTEMEELAAEASRTCDMARNSSVEWIHERQRSVQTLAALIGDPEESTFEQMQYYVETLKAATPAFLRMAVMNGRSLSVACSPLLDGNGKSSLGIDFSDSPQARAMKENRRPLIGDTATGMPGAGAPAALLLAPLVVGGEYKGYCEGVAETSSIHAILAGAAGDGGTSITLVDGNHTVIAGTGAHPEAGGAFERPYIVDGRIVPSETRHWIADPHSGTGNMQRWRGSVFVKIAAVSPDCAWKLVVETPVLPLLRGMSRYSIVGLGILALLTLCTVTLSHFFTAKMVSTIEKLRTMTRTVPDLIEQPGKIEWPRSRIAELEDLSNNIREMALALGDSFQQQASLNRSLEERVKARTVEIEEREVFIRDILDSLTAHVAVLDDGGEIVMANRAWMHSSLENSADSAFPGVGSNYIDAFERGIRRGGDAFSPDALKGIRAVMDGSLGRFCLDYPCRLPFAPEPLWFRMHVSRLSGRRRGVVVSHENITELKRAEEALRESQQQMESFFRQSLDGFFFMRIDEPVLWNGSADREKALDYALRHERVTKVNDALLTQYRATEEEFLELTIADLFAQDEASVKQAMWRLFDAGQLLIDTEARKLDGTSMWIQGHYMCLYDSAGRITGHFGIQRDITVQKKRENALKESEERLDLALKASGLGMWDINEQTGEAVFSDRWEEMLGYIPGELEPHLRTWEELVHPEDMPRVREALRAHYSGETPYFQTEYRLRGKNGDWVWILDQGRVTLRASDGSPLRAVGTHLDITEGRRKAELMEAERDLGLELSQPVSLEESCSICLEKALRVSHMDCGCLYLVNEADGSLERAIYEGLTEEFAQMVSRFEAGSERARLAQSEFPVYSSYEDIHPVLDETRRKEGLKALAIVPVRCQGRTVASLSAASHVLESIPEFSRYALERIANIIGVFMLHAKQEAEIAGSRRDLETLFNTISDFLFILDMRGRIIYHNAVVSERLGYAEDELVGKPILAVHPEERHEEARSAIAALRTQESCVCSIPLRKKSGEIIPVESKVHRGLWRNQEALVAICRDITDRKRAEEERFGLEQRLQRAQKVESLSRMAGAIAHNFNNMLGIVMGNLELVLGELPPGSEFRTGITEALKASWRASEIGRYMLTYLGQTVGKKEPLDVIDGIRDVFAILSPSLPKNVRVRMEFPECRPVVHADGAHFRQVVTNLVLNAVEAIGEQAGEVVVSVRVTGGGEIRETSIHPLDWSPQENSYACIEVSDTGCGMDAGMLDRIFDPFFSTKLIGKGLGLSVVHGVVRAHGGAVAVRSEPSAGTSFRVYLPLWEQAPVRSQLNGAVPGSRERKCVLLVEDDPMFRNMAKAMLERLGCDVTVACDGLEAVEIFRERKHEFHTVLLDLSMPRMDGWETLTALRKLRPDIPVVLTSGYDQAHAMKGEHAEQPQAFLCKPYQMKDLKEVLAISDAARDGSST
ncbi:MAG: PAS domain S-box protein [Syntrophobacteraceae bacterium]|nr:PAS domain S-box protein [Desulfobacteraceae bacterium]